MAKSKRSHKKKSGKTRVGKGIRKEAAIVKKHVNKLVKMAAKKKDRK